MDINMSQNAAAGGVNNAKPFNTIKAVGGLPELAKPR
jgi:hypothetical protein